MEITIRHICFSIIEMTVADGDSFIKTHVTNLSGRVPEDLIQNLKDVAEELELHNTEHQN